MLPALLCVGLLLFQESKPASRAVAPAPTSRPSFAQVVAEHFPRWDRNADGTLGADEIDVLCVDPGITGEPAAAAAAIKRIVRSGKYAVPVLTREYLTTPPPPAPRASSRPAGPASRRAESAPASAPARDADAQDRRDSGEAPAGALRPPNFQASYVASLRRIRTSKRDLFCDDTPDLDHCHQGPLGDCYFVAAVGAFVHRDSAAVKQMIQPRPEGGYQVRFADGKTVAVPPLTDAEIALSGTTGDEGLWLPVLEKALGAWRHQTDPRRYAMETATDAIAKGGSSATILRMLTGHQTRQLALKRRPRGTVPGPDGKPVPKPPVPAASADELAVKVRAEVGTALAQKRLVACGTGTEAQPPGISGKHAYAVLAFDADQDQLTLWNPHGNAFRPRGEPGLAHGYATQAGVFRIPVRDFVQVFNGVAVETDQPLAPVKSGGR